MSEAASDWLHQYNTNVSSGIVAGSQAHTPNTVKYFLHLILDARLLRSREKVLDVSIFKPSKMHTLYASRLVWNAPDATLSPGGGICEFECCSRSLGFFSFIVFFGMNFYSHNIYICFSQTHADTSCYFTSSSWANRPNAEKTYKMKTMLQHLWQILGDAGAALTT